MNDFSKVKADIIPYSPEYDTTIRSWIESEETYKKVCRGAGFPPPEEIIQSWQRDEVSSWLLFSENRPVAYGELWDRKMDMAVEIAHLIVDPFKRSQGFGSKMVDLLFKRGAQKNNVFKVVVSLYGESAESLGCFVNAGFELLGTANYTTGLKLVKLVDK